MNGILPPGVCCIRFFYYYFPFNKQTKLIELLFRFCSFQNFRKQIASFGEYKILWIRYGLYACG